VILDAIRRFGPDLVLVALGPLTNVAIALARDRDRFARLSRLVVMGGAVRVPGNVTPAAEFNFFTDPDAVAVVLASGIPVEVVPLDVTRQVLLTRRALDSALAGPETGRTRFLRDVTVRGFDRGEGERGMPLHDPLAVGVALDPTVVGLERLHVAMETEGRETRGMSLADLRALPAGERPVPTCAVATSVDAPRFLSLFLERVCRPSA
jgi:purine nucleosidase/pyrimidine-specific ribonucleoside hydrolase